MRNKIVLLASFLLLLLAVMLFALAARDRQAAKALQAEVIQTQQNIATLSKQTTASSSPNLAEFNIPPTLEPTLTDESSEDSVTNQDIKNLLLNLEARMTGLEREMEGLRVNERGQSQQDSALSSVVENSPLLNLFDENSNPTQQAKIMAQQQQAYQLSLDQRITAEMDTAISDDITVRYQDMFASKENWSDHIKVDLVQCGGDLCKVTLNYDKKALVELGVNELELDTSMIMPLAQDYPQSSVNYDVNPDGTTKAILYFAAKGTNSLSQ